MKNNSIDLTGIKEILNTYQQVHDNNLPKLINRSALKQKNRELESELNNLKIRYTELQNELKSREKKLSNLSQQLVDQNYHMSKLQDDFENVIFQISQNRCSVK